MTYREPQPKKPLTESQRTALQQTLQREWQGLQLLTEQAELKPYECDALAAFTQIPLAVVLPKNEAEVQQILQTCLRLNIPVVARGAGTGLTASSMPTPDGVLVAMSRFNRILNIDPEARTATVQPGVRNLAVSEAAAPHGLFYAPDPSSQLACSIGGNVSQNSGGLH